MVYASVHVRVVQADRTLWGGVYVCVCVCVYTYENFCEFDITLRTNFFTGCGHVGRVKNEDVYLRGEAGEKGKEEVGLEGKEIGDLHFYVCVCVKMYVSTRGWVYVCVKGKGDKQDDHLHASLCVFIYRPTTAETKA